MDEFLQVHQDDVEGALTMFDRLIFRGYHPLHKAEQTRKGKGMAYLRDDET